MYTVVHSVGPTIVIDLHSRDVSVLGEELSNPWDSASLRFVLAVAIMFFNFRVVSWICGCSTLGVATSMTGSQYVGGSFCELTTGSTRGPHSTSRRSWTRVLGVHRNINAAH